MKAAFFFIMEVPLTSVWRELTAAAVVGSLFDGLRETRLEIPARAGVRRAGFAQCVFRR